MIDTLIEKVTSCGNPSVVGLDTCLDYLPNGIAGKCANLDDIGEAIFEANAQIIDKIFDIVPAVKVQVAYYEMYGIAGMTAFKKTIDYAKSKGLVVIADVKRNDIGSTAEAYSKAYLSGIFINGRKIVPFESDFITVNGYLGSDGVLPFVKDCIECNKGIFVLVKTSNPSSGELQDRKLTTGYSLYESMGMKVDEWGNSCIGKYGYSRVGAVVGATHPIQAEILRAQMPHTMFLVPGYGAQGGNSDGLTVCFNDDGRGAIVNNSRGIICAYKKEQYKGLSMAEASRIASEVMRDDIMSALKKAGK